MTAPPILSVGRPDPGRRAGTDDLEMISTH